MQIKDPDVFALVERISVHFKNNVGNRYLRPSFMSMSLDSRTWELVESVTEKYHHFTNQGYHPDELYDRILAIARFIYLAKREIGPNLKGLLGGRGSSLQNESNDRVLRNMAVNNFNSNISILADLVNELYVRTVEIDTRESGGATPVFKQIPELTNLGRYLLE